VGEAVAPHPAAGRELTAFVREVVLPGGPDAVPRLDPEACRFRLTWGRSRIHRWGIFAAEPIPRRRRVIEYTGERIGRAEAYRRRLRPHIYLFWVGPRRAIDGAIGGSGAEFVNHGCEPNLVARVRGGRVTLVSLRPIAPGEELLLDYRITGDVPWIACRCGSPSCRGFMNLPPAPAPST
jgi:SET domain-containing protein